MNAWEGLGRASTKPRSTSRRCPASAPEIVLAVDGEWFKTRLFRSHEHAELVSANRGQAGDV
jgi:hypothetical protein